MHSSQCFTIFPTCNLSKLEINNQILPTTYVVRGKVSFHACLSFCFPVAEGYPDQVTLPPPLPWLALFQSGEKGVPRSCDPTSSPSPLPPPARSRAGLGGGGGYPNQVTLPLPSPIPSTPAMSGLVWGRGRGCHLPPTAPLGKVLSGLRKGVP